MKNYNTKEIINLSTYYFLDDLLHRTDGPAVECDNGYKAWYINGKFIGSNDKVFNQQKFEQYKKLICLI